MSDPLTLYRLFERGRLIGGDRQIRCVAEDRPTRTCGYAEFARDVARLVRGLRDRGLQPGDRVATLAGNGIEHLQLMWAVPLAGGVFHAINPRLPQDEVSYILDDADDRFVFVDAAMARFADALNARHEARAWFAMGLGAPPLPQGPGPLPCPGEARPEDIAGTVTDENAAAVLCYTSGTTGRPKGVAYSHRALVLHALMETAVDGYAIGHADRVLLMVPFCHGAGWGVPYSAFMCGTDMTILGGRFGPEHVVDVLARHEITFTGAVPEVVGQIAPVVAARGADLSGLRILMGGSPPQPRMLAALEAAGISCLLCWGMTETLSAATMLHRRSGSRDTGAPRTRPLPLTELSLGQPAGDGIGELLVRGPCAIERYWGHAAPARLDGWLPTGDIATIDGDGSLCIRDRKKDLIKSGGEWIAPAELEAVISGLPGIQGCAVVGVPHPKWGERPVCVTVGGALGRDEIADALLATGRFASWQVPDDVIPVANLPRTALGKLDRKALRASLRDHFESPGTGRDADAASDDKG